MMEKAMCWEEARRVYELPGLAEVGELERVRVQRLRGDDVGAERGLRFDLVTDFGRVTWCRDVWVLCEGVGAWLKIRPDVLRIDLCKGRDPAFVRVPGTEAGWFEGETGGFRAVMVVTEARWELSGLVGERRGVVLMLPSLEAAEPDYRVADGLVDMGELASLVAA